MTTISNPSNESLDGSTVPKTPPTTLKSNATFMRMFVAYALATFGDWFDTLAIQVMVAYRWGVDPFIIALIPVCMAVPGILLGSLAGTLADRVQKVRIMLLCDAITVVLTIAILFAPSALWLLPLLALRATMGVLHVPAQQALTRQVVAEEHLFQASAMNGFVAQCSKVAGPLLGAVILTLFSPQVCIVVNAVTRLISGAILWPLRQLSEDDKLSSALRGNAQTKETKAQHEPRNETQPESFRAQWQEGWRFIRDSRKIMSTLVFGCMGLMAILMIDYQFTTLFREIKPGHEAMVGWLGSSAGAGAVAIILLLNRLPRIGYGWGLGGGYLLIGAGIAALGWIGSETALFWIVVWGLFIGVGNGLFMVTLNYLLQKETPPAFTGRVFGIQNSLSSVVLVVAPLVGGILIRSAGASPAFQYIGIATFMIGIIGIVLQRVLWAEGKSPVATLQE
ncbi:MFS transporter [Paenibacillus sp. ACRSA]|uniref:MFS transporter n=1 Tax=Paenibacillus sp. ACRSA TaxID=2918211 RepID=UPI001EF527EF|nr:MFS transporter [Paenibacillus sp. ACRSA]MCG7378339.1 MFS transporter [Paenibacillus sp. ACRSA]